MGYAARANPRSLDGRKIVRGVLLARIARFCHQFRDRAAYEAEVDRLNLTAEHRVWLEGQFPAHLRAIGSETIGYCQPVP